MDIIFMNSEKSKTSNPHVLTLKLASKLVLEMVKRLLPYQIFAFITHGEI